MSLLLARLKVESNLLSHDLDLLLLGLTQSRALLELLKVALNSLGLLDGNFLHTHATLSFNPPLQSIAAYQVV
jgi:hypothetical protein